MSRVSHAQAQENRRRVVATAARLFREHGAQVSVAEVMNAAGLTHGGFYKQFDSKDALFDEAAAHALDPLTQAAVTNWSDVDSKNAVTAYLSVEHRDDMAGGCPLVALATDIARGQGSEATRNSYRDGVTQLARRVATDEDDGLSRLCTMVGALVLARATKGSPLSEDILAAALKTIT